MVNRVFSADHGGDEIYIHAGINLLLRCLSFYNSKNLGCGVGLFEILGRRQCGWERSWSTCGVAIADVVGTSGAAAANGTKA